MVILQKKDLYKLIPRILLFLFILAQLYFVIAIVKEKNINTWFVVVFILMAVILFFAYRKPQRLHIEHEKELHYELFSFLLAGSFTTYFLQHNIGFNTVFSAGLVGFTGSMLPKIKKFRSSKNWPIAIYCGAFVGMSKLEFGYYYLFTATFFTAVFYAFTQHLFHGIGGKLGTLAFMGVMYSYIIFKFFM
ncbi:hypothetical protein EVD20_06670 [Elizabethkingia bruuniana]|nr:hypothetical protein EVD20_06670 [Elizabethkingia bruuniana]